MPERKELPPETLSKINAAIEEIRSTEEFLNRAQSAGQDVSQQRNLLREKLQKLTAIKSAFYPNQ